MDIHSINRLASMEHEQRVQSIPVIPEYDAPNVEIQPGWALCLMQRFLRRLQQAFRPLGADRTPASSPSGSAVVIKNCGY
jgi:hypothetical protein